MVDYQKETGDRAERERARLLAQLDVAVSVLQAAVDKLSAAVKEHYDRVQEIDRLRLHVKENVLYYMQTIWRQEPPDQRFFRLYDLGVPIVTHDENANVTVMAGDNSSAARAVFDWNLPEPSRVTAAEIYAHRHAQRAGHQPVERTAGTAQQAVRRNRT